MRKNQDTMERLAAADPLLGGERLTPDEEREADALLARLLATPVAPEAARRRTLPRRLALAATAVACIAAGAFVASNLGSDGDGPGVVERAVAAVAQDDVVFHFVERMEATVPSEMGEDMTTYSESWNTADGRFHFKRYASPGPGAELLSEFAGRRLPGRDLARALVWDARGDTIREMGYGFDSGPVPHLDPLGDPGAQLKALEEQGRLRQAGTTEVDGRRAYRLESDPISRPAEPSSKERIVFLVDAETYLPLEKHHSIDTSVGRATLVSRYTVYERLPLNEHTSELLALDPHPGAKCSPPAVPGREVYFPHQQELGFPNPCAP